MNKFAYQIEKMTNKALFVLIMVILIALSACTNRQHVISEVVTVEKTKIESTAKNTVETEESSQVLITANNGGTEQQQAASPELTEIMDMKNTSAREETAVTKMRPAAIWEAAQLATFQKAMSTRYGQLVEETERYGNIMDTAFNFSPLLITQGQALILPPILAKAGASMRIEDGDTATSAKTTYELLEPARYISSPPTWRQFLMADNFPKPEEPNPALLPKTAAERAIWKQAVREAWDAGAEQADQLYADNVARMTREYRGIMLYHLLTAQQLLSKIGTASADLGRRASGNKLNIGQHVYRITKPSAFIANPGKKTATRKRRGGK